MKTACLVVGFSLCALVNIRADIPEEYTGKPMSGTPASVPGIIQAEAYDVAPDGTKDVTFGHAGEPKKSTYRPQADAVGVAGFGKGHVSTTGQAEAVDQVYVGWTRTGEWLKYTISVKEPGTYVFGGKFAAGAKDAKVSATFGPGLTTGPLAIPTTAGFQPGVEVYHVWETLDNLAEIQLPAGTYVMTVKIESGAGLNFDYFSLKKKS